MKLSSSILAKFKRLAQAEAIVYQDKYYAFSWLFTAVSQWCVVLRDKNIGVGKVVAIVGDFAPHVVAMLFALIDQGCIVVPLTNKTKNHHESLIQLAQVDVKISFLEENFPQFDWIGVQDKKHELINGLKQRSHPGLIIFSSGSSGKSKATVHDFVPLLQNNLEPRIPKRIIPFLMFDHIGGLNTMLYTLLNGGCLIILNDHSPEEVCHAIEKYNAQILPTSPTFLRLLLLGKAHEQFRLDSLEVITYGTEVMPQVLLDRLNKIFPFVKFKQNYGMSEIGVLRATSKSSDSLLLKINKAFVDYRVVNGLLEVKVKSTMLGYLNGESPFTEDGWLRTGDRVEVDGDYIKILGRESDMINVGGEKISAAEVEEVVECMPGVEHVVISAEANPLLGQIVKATVKLADDQETVKQFRERLNLFCQNKLLPYQIPRKIKLVKENLFNHRFKKLRKIA